MGVSEGEGESEENSNVRFLLTTHDLNHPPFANEMPEPQAVSNVTDFFSLGQKYYSRQVTMCTNTLHLKNVHAQTHYYSWFWDSKWNTRIAQTANCILHTSEFNLLSTSCCMKVEAVSLEKLKGTKYYSPHVTTYCLRSKSKVKLKNQKT